MNLFVTILATVGLYTVLWFVVGVIAFTYTNVYIARGVPLSVKLKMVVSAGFELPWQIISRGVMPSEILSALTPINPTEEDIEHFQKWWTQRCKCEGCRQVRKEKGWDEGSGT